jgi:hypothetical protein
MSKPSTLGAALFAVLAIQGCSASGTRLNRPEPKAGPSEITIDNQSLSTVDVYVVYNDQTYRVDQVFGGQKVTEEMPKFVAPQGSIRVLVDPFASYSAYLSDPVPYLSDENFTLTVREPLQFSTFLPYVRG